MKVLGSLMLAVMLLSGVSFIKEASVSEQSITLEAIEVREVKTSHSLIPVESVYASEVTSETIKSDPLKALGLSKFVDAAKWVLAHAPDILAGLMALLVALGAVVEALTRLIPTENGKSALQKIGEYLISAGKILQKIMDFLRIPNVKK